jgi:hypothetical protein
LLFDAPLLRWIIQAAEVAVPSNLATGQVSDQIDRKWITVPIEGCIASYIGRREDKQRGDDRKDRVTLDASDGERGGESVE